ncbi:MAG: hypothetical protein HY755_12700 [Nitrospirae bacterium]|nr:hypothetical protein [Nitrospirota bacterium]
MKRSRKKKEYRYATSFTMRFDSFTLAMLEKIAHDEDKMRPEVIRAAVKYLFIKKYGLPELENLRKEYRPEILREREG